MGRRWRTSSPDWRRRGSASAGCPAIWSIDNCPPAVAGPDPLHPRFTRGFLEYSGSAAVSSVMRRGLRKPKDKPKVERGVQYVRERFFKGGGLLTACGPPEGRSPALVSGGSRNAHPWHHSPEAPGGLPGRGGGMPCCPGPRSGRDTSCCVWASVTRQQRLDAACRRACGRGSHRRAPVGTHPGAGPGTGGHAPTALAHAAGPLRPSR